MNKQAILTLFKQTGAMMQGHFKLSSGLHSAQYLQCARVLRYPKHAEALCGALAAKFKHLKPTVVVAPALGGVIVSYEVARSLGVPGIFTERVDGKMTLRRGFELKENDSVLIVEDVITTGRSTKEVIEVVKSFGSKLIGVGCIVDRSSESIDLGTNFDQLIKIDIPTFRPTACPICVKGQPLTKPGSRK